MKGPKEQGAHIRNGDRASCVICNPRDRIPYWRVWTGEFVLNDGVQP